MYGQLNPDYMPLGVPTTQEDGNISRVHESPSSFSVFPLTDINSPLSYQAQSPPTPFSPLPRPAPDRSSSSSTLLGGEETYFQYPRRESTQTTQSYRKSIDGGKSYPQEFKPWKQFFHLLGTGFLRFLLTAGLIVAIYEVIWTYSSYPILDTSQKRMFNFLVTALSLALGLNLASSMKSVAIKARWWILSWEKRPLSEVESILSSHSLTTVIKLGCKSTFTKPSVTIACLLWLLVNLAIQAFVAALGLNWSIEPAIDTASHVEGNIVFSNMSQFYFKNDGIESTRADQITAHLYGDLAISYIYNHSNPDQVNLTQIVPPLSLYSSINFTDIWDFPSYAQYVFMDTAPGDSSIGTWYSNRSINAGAICDSYAEKVTLANDGTVEMLNITNMQPNSTTYIVKPDDDGAEKGCGNRCAQVFVLENDGSDGYFYSCNVSVGEVSNTTRWVQQVQDDHARMAAQSVALNGYGYGQWADGSQSQQYSHDFIFGVPVYGNTTDMEWLLRVHAISTIVSADRYNPYVEDPIPGMLPTQGVQLTLDHPEFIEAILGGIGGFHFLLFILAAYFSNKVVVIHDSYLAISLMLRSVVARLKNHGSLLDEKGICHALGDPEVAFGCVEKTTMTPTGTGTVRHMDISEVAERPRTGWRGWYD